jgi:hypothetical protein
MDAGIHATLRVNEIRLLGIVFCGYLALSTLKNLPFMFKWYRSHHGLFGGVSVLGIWRPPTLDVRLFPLLLSAFISSLLAYASWTNRLFGISSLVLYFAIFPGITACNLVHQKSSLIPLVLSILLLSGEFHGPLFYLQPPGEVTDGVQWPLICIRLLLAAIYLAIGFDKMMKSGWGWTKGKALRWYLLEHYLWGGFALAVPLLRHPRALRLLSTATVLMQLLAPLIVLGGWIPAIHGVAAVGFHLSTQIFMGIYFLTFFGPALVSSAVSYPVARLAETYLTPAQLSDSVQIAAVAPVSSTIWQIPFMFMVPLVQVYCQVVNRHRFPFGPYRLFSYDLSEFKNLGVLLLELGNASGEYRPWHPLDYYDIRDVGAFGYDPMKRVSRLSPRFEAHFSMRYWPIIQRESEDDARSIRSIRLVSRTAAWDGDTPVGYDDYTIGLIRINGDQVGRVETTPRVHLRTHRF